MKHVQVLYLFMLLCISNAAAQSFSTIEDSLHLAEFEHYVQSVLEHELNTLNATDHLGNYLLVYRSGCSYSETITLSDSGFCDIISSTGGKHLSVRINSKKQLTDSAFRIPIPSEPGFKVCLDNVEFNQDSLSYHVSVLPVHVDQTVEYRKPLSVEVSGLGSFPAVSFNQGKYLILSSSGISYVGSQTSHGSTVTYFLERGEE